MQATDFAPTLASSEFPDAIELTIHVLQVNSSRRQFANSSRTFSAAMLRVFAYQPKLFNSALIDMKTLGLS